MRFYREEHRVAGYCDRRRIAGLGLGIALIMLQATCLAGPREQAKRLHDRLASVPPDAATLNAMESDIASGDAMSAAFRAIEHPAFYDVTLVNFAAPASNRDQDLFVALNDFSATVVGLIRDDRDFREALQADVIYTASGQGLPAYSTSDNRHYEEIETRGIELKTALQGSSQSTLNGLPAAATAGLMTTRAGAQAFFKAGTNRAMLRFTMMNFLCHDLESVKDISLPPDRIRQDVTRSPGGDSRIFLNNCIGCHSGMDPLAQAFAYYNFPYDVDNDPDGLAGTLVYNDVGHTDPATGTRVQAKYHINADTFSNGYVTADDRWDNYWRQGRNAALGWDPALNGSGNGARSLGQELAHSQAFAQCQVRKAFRQVCLREPEDAADRSEVDRITASFVASGYRMKQAFAEAAIWCMGD